MKNEKCPNCGCDGSQYLHGKTVKNNKRYRCGNCRKTYILNESQYTVEFKNVAVQMYIDGNSGRSVSKILGIGKNTVLEWYKNQNKKSLELKNEKTGK